MTAPRTGSGSAVETAGRDRIRDKSRPPDQDLPGSVTSTLSRGAPCNQGLQFPSFSFGWICMLSLFLSLLSPPPPVPTWAAPFKPRQHQKFLRLVEGELTRRSLQFEFEDNGVVRLLAQGDEPHRCGLQNLAQVCAMSRSRQWPAIVSTHFEHILQTREELARLEADIADFSRVAPLIKLRVFPEELPDETRFNNVHRVVAPGLLAMVSFDLPNSVASVSRETASRWELSEEQLIRHALENTWETDPAGAVLLEGDDSLPLWALSGESFFSATHALMLEKHLPAPAPHGVLVIIPTRHAVVFHVIAGPEAVKAVQKLLGMAFAMHRDGPGSVSPSLYWWRDGCFALLPSFVRNNSLSFHPPDEFAAMLNQLCAGKS